MNSFIQKHQHLVIHSLSGFDRLVIRGTLRNLSYVQGMLVYLSGAKVLLKDFKDHVLKMSRLLKQSLFGCRISHRKACSVSYFIERCQRSHG